MKAGGQHHGSAALPPGKTRYPLYRRLGGPQCRSGPVRKISPPTGIRSPDRPARSESLYRLSYRGPFIIFVPEQRKCTVLLLLLVTHGMFEDDVVNISASYEGSLGSSPGRVRPISPLASLSLSKQSQMFHNISRRHLVARRLNSSVSIVTILKVGRSEV